MSEFRNRLLRSQTKDDAVASYVATDGNCWIETDIPDTFENLNIVASFRSMGGILWANTDNSQAELCNVFRRSGVNLIWKTYGNVNYPDNVETKDLTVYSLSSKDYSVKYRGGKFGAEGILLNDKDSINIAFGNSNLQAVSKYRSTNLRIFGTGPYLLSSAGTRLYGLDVYNNSGNLTYSLRPWYQNEWGLKDVVNNKFYGASGSGTLTGKII